MVASFSSGNRTHGTTEDELFVYFKDSTTFARIQIGLSFKFPTPDVSAKAIKATGMLITN